MASTDVAPPAVVPDTINEKQPELAIRTAPTSTTFDIVKTYNDILSADPELTKPVAAINALIALLNTIETTTVMETMGTLREHSRILRQSVKNPVPLFAGTDLFKQVLLQSFEGQNGGYDQTKQHLLRNGRLFAQRAVDARNELAEKGKLLVRDGKTILTHGASRTVVGLLESAARERPGKFKVIYVRDEWRAEESDQVVRKLRALGIPTAEIDQSSVAHVMGLLRQVHMVFVGAEAVTQNGGIITRMGTLQIAQLAEKAKIPFYVAAESHKFVRQFPLDQRDIGFKQTILDFTTDRPSEQLQDAVDYTPPNLITNLITENGVQQASAVFEQLLEFYGSLRSDDDV